MQTNEMILFSKEVEIKNGDKKGQKMNTYFMRYPKANVFISTQLTNEVKAKILLSGIKFPMSIKLRYYTQEEIEKDKVSSDYFMTEKSFENKHGETQIQAVCVIRDYESISNYVFETKSLNDFINENEGSNTMEDINAENVDETDLPF